MDNIAKKKIDEIYSTGQVVSEFDKTTHTIFPVSIDPVEGKSLQEVVKQENPKTVIEIGLGYGFAALNVFAGINISKGKDFRYITIDPNQESRFSNIGLQLLQEIEASDCVEFHNSLSELVLPHLIEANEKADFAIVMVITDSNMFL